MLLRVGTNKTLFRQKIKKASLWHDFYKVPIIYLIDYITIELFSENIISLKLMFFVKINVFL